MSQMSAEPSSSLLARIHQHELEEARTIQEAMIPKEPLEVPPIELRCKFRPAAHIGGDFLDYFSLDGQQVGFYIGDVTGKGLPAALYAALVAGTLRGFKKSGVAPRIQLEQLNKRLRMRAVQGRYCAVQYALFDSASRTIEYANAGLPPPLHITPAGCQPMQGAGLPSALFDDARYESCTARLSRGEAILFTTDGLIEAQDFREEQFGLERLMAVCAENKEALAGALLDRIFAAVDDFAAGAQQHDDMTAALLKVG